MNSTHAKSGFTLIEILIAVAIVAIMAGGSFYVFGTYRKRSAITSTKSSLRVLSTAIEQYELDTGEHPTTLRDLVTRPSNENISEKWIGPYIEGKNVFKDGFGIEFHYAPTPDGEHPYELYSYGGPRKKSAPKKEWIDVWKL